jgi:hypothetical protein
MSSRPTAIRDGVTAVVIVVCHRLAVEPLILPSGAWNSSSAPMASPTERSVVEVGYPQVAEMLSGRTKHRLVISPWRYGINQGR